MKRLATRIIAVLLTFICMSADVTAKDVEICLNLDGDKKIFVKDSRHLSLKIYNPQNETCKIRQVYTR